MTTNKLHIGIKFMLALVPGLNHLIDGQYKQGFKYLGIIILLLGIARLKWENIVVCLESKAVGYWSAPVLLFLLFILVWCGSIIYVWRREIKPKEPLKNKGSFNNASRRFAENKLALYSAYVLILLFLIAFLAPILSPFDPNSITDVVETRFQPPGLEHLFGTDVLGRDLFSRALYGARISLSIGVLSVLISMTIGTIYGAVAGYFGGAVDNVLMRFVDVIMAFPIFFLMLLLVGVFEADILMLILILGFTSWPGTARYIRGEILSLRERPFIESAKAIGLPSRVIIWRHLIPNALSPVLVSAALMVGGMITAEAGLSFLGIGIRPPTPSWGNMISEGEQAIFTGWWIAFFPGFLLTITILCFNLLADGLRDAFDTKTLTRKYV